MLASLPASYLDVRYMILLTLALSTAIIAVVGAIPALGGATGLTSLPFPSVFGTTLLEPSQWFRVTLVIALIVLAICWRMVHSPFGRVLRGVRDDEVATRGVGKNVVRYKVTVFGVTAAMAGIAGALISYYDSSIQPTAFGLSQSLEIIAMIVIGGTANLLGSILGATILILVSYVLTNVINISTTTSGYVQLFIYGALIIAFMMLLPQGLLRERWTLERLWDKRRHHSTAARRARGHRRRRWPRPPARPSPAGNGHCRRCRQDRARGAWVAEVLRRHPCGRRAQPRAAHRTDHRADRPQRRRQDDGLQPSDPGDPARRGSGHAV